MGGNGAERASCLTGGARQRCPEGMAACQSPLADSDEGGHVCLITGLCIAAVRTSTVEYVDHVVFDSPGPRVFSSEDEGVYERVYSTVHWFLSSVGTVECRRQEREKYAQKTRQGVWRVLKQRKRDSPYSRPCVCRRSPRHTRWRLECRQ